MAPEVSAGAAGGEGGNETGLPARILEAATRLFAEHGWTGTSVRAVADAAGCTPPALYYHFAGKDALWTAAVEACFRRLAELQMSARRQGATVREQLVVSLETMSQFAQVDPHQLWLLYRMARHPEEGQPPSPAAAHRDAARKRTVALLRQGIDSGEIRPDIDPEVVVSLIHGAMDQRLGELFYDGRPIEERWAARAVEHLFRGLVA